MIIDADLQDPPELNVSAAKPMVKKRSQFRVKSAGIPALYTAVTEVNVAA